MNRRDEFWSRADALLDERRDPLQDGELQRLIAEEPALLDEWARFESALAGARLPRPRRSRVALVATVLVLTAVAIAAVSIRERPPESLASVCRPDASRVLVFESTFTHVDDRGTTTVSFDGVTRTQTFVARTPAPVGPGPGSVSFVATILSTRFEHQP
jgi:hypothetical protein